MYSLWRRLLFRYDPERAHEWAVRGLESLQSFPALLSLSRKFSRWKTRPWKFLFGGCPFPIRWDWPPASTKTPRFIRPFPPSASDTSRWGRSPRCRSRATASPACSGCPGRSPHQPDGFQQPRSPSGDGAFHPSPAPPAHRHQHRKKPQHSQRTSFSGLSVQSPRPVPPRRLFRHQHQFSQHGGAPGPASAGGAEAASGRHPRRAGSAAGGNRGNPPPSPQDLAGPDR